MEIKISKTYMIELTQFERAQLCDELYDNKLKLNDCSALNKLYQLLHNEK